MNPNNMCNLYYWWVMSYDSWCSASVVYRLFCVGISSQQSHVDSNMMSSFFYFSERSFFSTHQGRKYTALTSTKFRRHRKRKSQLPTSLVHCSWSDGQILITEKIVIFFHSIPGHSPEFGINSTNSDTNSCARRSDCYFTSRNNHFYSWIELFTILLLHFSSHLNFTL